MSEEYGDCPAQPMSACQINWKLSPSCLTLSNTNMLEFQADGLEAIINTDSYIS